MTKVATLGPLLCGYTSLNGRLANDRFGSLADLFGNDRRMSASAGKADVSRTIVDSKILNVCFSQ